MKILKVTRDDSSVQFRHEVQGHKAIEERDHTCHEAPLKAFDAALQNLSDVAVNILELGQAYKKGIVIIALALSYTKKGTRSATIVFSKEIDATKGTHRMTTPAFQFDDASEGEDGQRRQCSKKHAEMIQEMIDETEKYANGERQQRLLPLTDGKSEGAEPTAGDTLKFDQPPAGTDGEGAAAAPEQPKKKRSKKAAK